MRFVGELGASELTGEQVEHLCTIAEEAARKHVLAKVPSKSIEVLNVGAEAEGTEPLKLTVDVDVTLSPSVKNVRVKRLCDDAVKKAFGAAEEYMRQLKCHSQK